MNKYEEALKWIKSLHSSIGEEPYYESLGLLYGQGVAESIKTIEELVEKATPMKPTGTVAYRRCGRCSTRVRSGEGSSSRTRDTVCRECFQVIDWEDKA